MSPNGSVNFNLTEEQQMIQQLARDFARNEIAPVAEHYDKTHEYPWPVIKKAQGLGPDHDEHPGGVRRPWFEHV